MKEQSKRKAATMPVSFQLSPNPQDNHRPGDLYKAISVGGHTFHVHYGRPSENASDESDVVPLFPDFARQAVYDKDGYRIACAFNEACPHYLAISGNLDDNLCMTCTFFPTGFPDIGVCCCEERRRESPRTLAPEDVLSEEDEAPVDESKRGEVLLAAQGVVVAYPHGDAKVLALKGVDLHIRKGELTVILGESGCGKTSLLNVLGGMLAPSEGALVHRRRDISRLNRKEKTRYRRDSIGFVFQHYNLIADLTAAENIKTASALVKNPLSTEEVLSLVGLAGKGNKYPRQLSGGEQQRVCIARALVKRAEILLCDEPTGALDSANAKNIASILQRLAKEQEAAVVVVTHNPALSALADHLVTMRDGKIVTDEFRPFPLSAELGL